jgi:hypothetical protein
MRHFSLSAVLVLLACTGADTDPTDTAPKVTAEDCTDAEVFVNACLACGPTDACTERADLCVPVCEGDFTPCGEAEGLCVDGACLPVVCG